MKITVTNEDLLRKAHRNDLILKTKLVPAILIGLVSWYLVAINTSNRFANLIPPSLTLALLVADSRSRGQKLRESAATKDAWRAQISPEAEKYVSGLSLSKRITELELIEPDEPLAPSSSTSSSSRQSKQSKSSSSSGGSLSSPKSSGSGRPSSPKSSGRPSPSTITDTTDKLKNMLTGKPTAKK